MSHALQACCDLLDALVAWQREHRLQRCGRAVEIVGRSTSLGDVDPCQRLVTVGALSNRASLVQLDRFEGRVLCLVVTSGQCERAARVVKLLDSWKRQQPPELRQRVCRCLSVTRSASPLNGLNRADTQGCPRRWRIGCRRQFMS